MLQLALCDIERAVRFIDVVHQKVIVGLISVVEQVARGLLEQLHLSPCFGIHRVTARQSACQFEGIPRCHRFIGGDTLALDGHSRRLWAAVGVLTRDVHVEAVKGQTVLVLLTRLVVMAYQTKRRRGIQINTFPQFSCFGAAGRLGRCGRQPVGHDFPVRNGAYSAARVPAPFLTEVDATVPDAVATNQESAALETVDLLDKGIEGGNVAGGVASPSCHP